MGTSTVFVTTASPPLLPIAGSQTPPTRSPSVMHAIAALFIFAPAIICLTYVLVTSFIKRLRRRRTSLDPESLRSTSLFLSRLHDPLSFDEPYSRGWLQRYLPVVAYDKRQHASSAPSAASPGPDECAVCLCCFNDGEPVRTLPACRHAFHMDCIDMWLESHWNCPVCREEIRPLNDPKGKAAPLSGGNEGLSEAVIAPPSESQSVDEARGQSPGEVGGAGIPSPLLRRSSPTTTLDTQASRDAIGDVDGEQEGGRRRAIEEGEREPLTLTTNTN